MQKPLSMDLRRVQSACILKRSIKRFPSSTDVSSGSILSACRENHIDEVSSQQHIPLNEYHKQKGQQHQIEMIQQRRATYNPTNYFIKPGQKIVNQSWIPQKEDTKNINEGLGDSYPPQQSQQQNQQIMKSKRKILVKKQMDSFPPDFFASNNDLNIYKKKKNINNIYLNTNTTNSSIKLRNTEGHNNFKQRVRCQSSARHAEINEFLDYTDDTSYARNFNALMDEYAEKKNKQSQQDHKIYDFDHLPRLTGIESKIFATRLNSAGGQDDIRSINKDNISKNYKQIQQYGNVPIVESINSNNSQSVMRLNQTKSQASLLKTQKIPFCGLFPFSQNQKQPVKIGSNSTQRNSLQQNNILENNQISQKLSLKQFVALGQHWVKQDTQPQSTKACFVGNKENKVSFDENKFFKGIKKEKQDNITQTKQACLGTSIYQADSMNCRINDHTKNFNKITLEMGMDSKINNSNNIITQQRERKTSSPIRSRRILTSKRFSLGNLESHASFKNIKNNNQEHSNHNHEAQYYSAKISNDFEFSFNKPTANNNNTSTAGNDENSIDYVSPFAIQDQQGLESDKNEINQDNIFDLQEESNLNMLFSIPTKKPALNQKDQNDQYIPKKLAEQQKQLTAHRSVPLLFACKTLQLPCM